MLQRKFIPGSEWLYLKLYTGIKTTDRLLTDQISTFVKNLMGNKVIDKFFFIRYSDPEFHVRLRLRLLEAQGYGRVLSDVHSHFAECVGNDMISKIMCDTYVREIERYGEDTMLLSEDIFHIDSDAILSLLSGDESQIPRWHIALLLVDDMIRIFIPKQDDRRKFTSRLAESYKREFGFESGRFTKQLNDKYRSLRPYIEKVLLREGDYPMSAILERRKEQLFAISTKFDENILSSHIHMCVNRLFRSNNRLNEMVVYDYLSRYYESVAAREKYSLAKL